MRTKILSNEAPWRTKRCRALKSNKIEYHVCYFIFLHLNVTGSDNYANLNQRVNVYITKHDITIALQLGMCKTYDNELANQEALLASMHQFCYVRDTSLSLQIQKSFCYIEGFGNPLF